MRPARVRARALGRSRALAQDIHVYVSADPSLQSFEGAVPVWRAQGVPYSLKAPTQRHTAVLPLSEAAQHNGTLFAHVFVTPHGRSPDPQDESHARTLTSNVSHALVVHGPRPTFAPLRNLLTGERPPWQAALFDSLPPGHERQWISFFKPAVSINVVVDHESYELNAIPMVLWQHWFEQRLVSRREGRFKPIVFLNELAMVKGSWVPLNASVAEVELSLDAQPMSIRRFVWMLNLRQSFALQEETLGISEKESEELRGMFTNTHPVLLYTTVGVSALHLLFDVLAFKHDISFWRSVESMEGLSTRSVFANVAMEAVILVYLVDEGASWLVQLGSGLTLLVGVFKMFKSLRVRRADAARAAGGVSETDMYDRLAYSRLAPPVVLLVVGYAAWELLFDFHRGWWAWALNSLVALVYGVGFIVMTPQLFINYKLKSVAHLPWRFFFYKFLNTFMCGAARLRAHGSRAAAGTRESRVPPRALGRTAPRARAATISSPSSSKCRRSIGCRASATTSSSSASSTSATSTPSTASASTSSAPRASLPVLQPPTAQVLTASDRKQRPSSRARCAAAPLAAANGISQGAAGDNRQQSPRRRTSARGHGAAHRWRVPLGCQHSQ